MSREIPDPNRLQEGFEVAGAIIRIWRVQTTDDESGKPGATKGWYSNKQAALDANHKAGWYGGKGILSEHLALKTRWGVYPLQPTFPDKWGDIRDMATVEPIDLDQMRSKSESAERSAALAKLTPRERVLLDIKLTKEME